MRIIRDFEHCPNECQGAVLALGNFDGVHLGHQAIIHEAVQRARADRIPAAVMTFEPHPRQFFTRTHAPLAIYPLRRKLQLLAESGLNAVFLMRFNARLAATSAEDFIRHILVQSLQVSHVTTGADFAFGKGRGGNVQTLRLAAKEHGFGFSTVECVSTPQGERVSSSAIRAALVEGSVQKVAMLLGRAYTVEGVVCHGAKRGRQLGFPTANLALTKLCLPRFGVYAARCKVDEKWYPAVVNIGIKPTFGNSAPLLEAHLLGSHDNLYGKRIAVELVTFLRDEQIFSSVEALRAQIVLDSQQALRLLEGCV